MRARLLLVLIAIAIAPQAAGAAGPLLFQHGARGTAQAGALTARAVDPSAVAYNPAAIARLPGLQLQAGLDFTAPRDDYKSATGAFAQDHLITLAPAFYLTWHLPEEYYPWAFGLGLDSRAWYVADWKPVSFPGRFRNRRQEVTLFALHPVVAYQIDERWSVGGGLRYYVGDLEEGRNQLLQVRGSGPGTVAVEVERLAAADVDGIGFDLGVSYAAVAWGWGLVLDGGAEVEGSGKVSYQARDVPDLPGLRAELDRLLASGSTRQSFELPWEARTGFWVAPYPELRLELDLALMGWSVVDETSILYSPNPFASAAPGSASHEVTRRDWDDTLSVRLGVEGEVSEHWTLFGGIALEPSPVPAATLEPGFARGDAMVYGLGMSYTVESLSLELAYSFVDYDDRSAVGQEALQPTRRGTFETHDQVFAFAVIRRY